ELLRRGEERVVRGMAVRNTAQREGQEEGAPRARPDGASELVGRRHGIPEGEMRDRHEPSPAPRRELLDPPVVGPAVGEGVAWVVDLRLPLEAEARVEERARCPRAVEAREPW